MSPPLNFSLPRSWGTLLPVLGGPRQPLTPGAQQPHKLRHGLQTTFPKIHHHTQSYHFSWSGFSFFDSSWSLQSSKWHSSVGKARIGSLRLPACSLFEGTHADTTFSSPLFNRESLEFHSTQSCNCRICCAALAATLLNSVSALEDASDSCVFAFAPSPRQHLSCTVVCDSNMSQLVAALAAARLDSLGSTVFDGKVLQPLGN